MATLALIGPGPLRRARDAKRKGDLARMKRVLEDYYNDNDRYPTTLPDTICKQDFGKYGVLPCDPVGNARYKYSYMTNPATGRWYKLYATLEVETDPVIPAVGCVGGCPGGDGNWGVSSPNVGLTGCEDGFNTYGCQGAQCNSVNLSSFGGVYKCSPVGCHGAGCCPNSCQ